MMIAAYRTSPACMMRSIAGSSHSMSTASPVNSSPHSLERAPKIVRRNTVIVYGPARAHIKRPT